MAHTTTLRLPEEFRGRISAAAAQRGTTAHAFMIEAISEALASAELRAAFHRDADQGLEDLLETGEGLMWDEMVPWLRARAAGQEVPPAPARPWR